MLPHAVTGLQGREADCMLDSIYTRPDTHLWPISWTMTAVFSAEAPLRYLHFMRTADSGCVRGRTHLRLRAGSTSPFCLSRVNTHVQQV